MNNAPRFFGVLVLAVFFLSGRGQAAEKPNVVLVVTDDQGYGDLGCHGNPLLKTPNIDRLFRESLRLTDFHVAPTCSPTRAALQTGHWTDRTGVWHTIMGRSLLRENEITIGRVFQDAGYATGMFGKWHLGDNYPYRPEDRGFTEVMRHGGGGVSQTPDYWNNAYFDGHYFHNGRPEAVQGYCTDVWFDYAQRFIKQQQQAGKPFLAYIATNAPHGPMHCPPEYSAPYLKENIPKNTAYFLGMIANVDDNVGRLRKFLDQQGLTRNTIFIFMTDNGTSSGDRVFNAHMRGRKGSEYDGGHRVPFFIHWPAGGYTTGRDISPITAHVDVLPTLIDLCGIAAPRGVRFDGRSIRPLLEGAAKSEDGSWPDRILVTDSQRVKDPIKWRKTAVMTSDWRLINGRELYDIKADPGQKKNVAAQHRAVVARLAKFYDAWWEELLPTFQQDCAIYLGHPAENPATLTCHDWITTRLAPWNHGHIRDAMSGEGNTGFWHVQVVEDGEYEIRLRRWPQEADTAIVAGLKAAADVPGAKAYRARPGKAFPAVRATIEIGGQQKQASVQPGQKEIVFTFKLKAGRTRLRGDFFTAAGKTIGAYYAYVKKI